MTRSRILEVLSVFQPFPHPPDPSVSPETAWKSLSARQIREALAAAGLPKSGARLDHLVDLKILEKWNYRGTALYRPVFPPGININSFLATKGKR